jgi:hypothetical protein
MRRGTLFLKLVTALSFPVSSSRMQRWQRRATNNLYGFPAAAGLSSVAEACQAGNTALDGSSAVWHAA